MYICSTFQCFEDALNCCFNFSDDFVLPSRIEFLGRTLQLLLAFGALLAFLALDLNPQERCSADDGIIYSLIALIVVSR